MSTTPPTLQTKPPLVAPLNFLVSAPGKPQVLMSVTKADTNVRTGEFRHYQVPMNDARAVQPPASLDREGFQLVRRPTAMTDFFDPAAIERIYYPEVIQLLKDVTGAADVRIFDHTIRVQDDGKRREKAVRPPVPIIHNDYTDKSAPVRIGVELEKDAAERYLAGRYAMVNVWRSIGLSAERAPLAMADASSVDKADFVATDLVYEDRTGEIYQNRYRETQRWYYYPDLQRDEAVLLKCFDSATDGRARYSAHGAFINPEAPADAPARESIEVRAVLSFD